MALTRSRAPRVGQVDFAVEPTTWAQPGPAPTQGLSRRTGLSLWLPERTMVGGEQGAWDASHRRHILFTASQQA